MRSGHKTGSRSHSRCAREMATRPSAIDRSLVDASEGAGTAEVATEVLRTLGAVPNSIGALSILDAKELMHQSAGIQTATSDDRNPGTRNALP